MNLNLPVIRSPLTFHCSSSNQAATSSQAPNNTENSLHNFHPADPNEAYIFCGDILTRMEMHLESTPTSCQEEHSADIHNYFYRMLNNISENDNSEEKLPQSQLKSQENSRTSITNTCVKRTWSLIEGTVQNARKRKRKRKRKNTNTNTNTNKTSRLDSAGRTCHSNHEKGANFLNRPPIHIARFNEEEMDFFRSFTDENRQSLESGLLGILNIGNNSLNIRDKYVAVTEDSFKRFIVCGYAAMLYRDLHKQEQEQEQDTEYKKSTDFLYDLSTKIWNAWRQCKNPVLKNELKERSRTTKDILLNKGTPVGVVDRYIEMFKRRSAEFKGKSSIGIKNGINYAEKILEEFFLSDITKHGLSDVTWLEFLKETSPDNPQLDEFTEHTDLSTTPKVEHFED